MPNVSVRLGKTKTSAPEKMRRRKRRAQRLARGSVADHDLGAGKIEAQERLDVLLHRDAPDIEKDRPRQVEAAALARMVQATVHAARPHDDAFKAARDEFVAH
jgi:hypothetical protein